MDNPLKYSDLLQPDRSLSDAIDQLTRLNTAFETLSKNVSARAEEVKGQLQKQSGATREQQLVIQGFAEEATRLSKLQAQALKEQRAAELALQKVTTEKLRQEKLKQKAAKTERLSIKEAIELSRQEVHSIEEANEANKRLRQTVRQITDAEDKEGRIRAELNSQIQQNTNYIKRNSDAMIRQKMNVGNYTESIKLAYAQIKNGNNVMGNMGIIARSLGGAFRSDLASGVAQVSTGIGNMVKGFVGAQAVLLAITKTVGAFKEGVKTIVDYQAANSKLAAILGTTVDGVKELHDDSLRLGAATAYTASQVVELQTELARLGFTKQEILDVTADVLKFATATGSDLGEAATVAGAALRAFGATSKEMKRYVSTMAVATTKSALSFSDLSTAISTAAPVAKAFGFTIEDLMALMGALKNAGFDASSAATATRNILLNLANAGGKLAKALGQPITSLSDLSTAFATLRDKGVDLSTALELTDKRSVAAFESFLTQAEGLETLRRSITGAEADLYSMADTMADNVAGSLRKMQSAWEGLMLTFERSTGPMKKVVDWITSSLNSLAYDFKDLDGKNKQVVDSSIAAQDQLMMKTGVVSEFLSRQVQWRFDEMVKSGKSEAEAAKQVREDIQKELRAEYAKEEKQQARHLEAQKELQKEYDGATLWQQMTGQRKSNLEYENAIRAKSVLIGENAAEMYKLQTKMNALASYDFGIKQQTTKTTPTTEASGAGTKPKGADRTQQIAQKNLDIQRQAAETEVAIMADGQKKERRQIETSYAAQIATLQNKLDNDKDLTAKSRDAINAMILTKEQLRDKELSAVDEKYRQRQLQKEQETISLRLAATAKGSEDELALQLQAVENQRKQALAKNAALTEEMRQSEADINAKYNKQAEQTEKAFRYQQRLTAFDAEQRLSEAEFNLTEHTEEEKTRFKLQAEAGRQALLLQLAECGMADLSETEIAVMRKTLAKMQKMLSTSTTTSGKKDLFDLMGLKLDDGQKQAIEQSTSYVVSQFQEILAAQTEIATAAYENAQTATENAKSQLEAEIEARNNGYANSVETAKKELALAEEKEEKALKRKKKAEQAQEQLDTLTQTSSLITASANIWSSLSSIPIVGVGLAIAAISTMFASFAAAKVKARQAAGATEYGEGGLEFLDGGSHQSGDDVDLGRTEDGRPRRAEGGEMFAIINKRNTRKYRRDLPDIVRSLNQGTFERRFARTFDGSERLAPIVTLTGAQTDTATIERELRAIRRQGEEQAVALADGTVLVRRGNVQRIIRRV
jgi:TP901 family phage tail tape measure protein